MTAVAALSDRYILLAGIPEDASSTTPFLLQLDLQSMAVSHFSGVDPATHAALGSGAAFTTISDLVPDPANNRVLVVAQGQILAVDLTTGSRSIYATFADSSSAKGWKLDLAKNRLLGAQSFNVVALDLASGAKSVFSILPAQDDNLAESYTKFPDLNLTLDPESNLLFVNQMRPDGSPRRSS